MSSFSQAFNTVSNFFKTGKLPPWSDVLIWYNQLQNDVLHTQQEIDQMANWVDANTATIMKDVQELQAVLTALLPGQTVAIQVSVAAIDEAVKALDAYAAARQVGETSAQSVAQGVKAVTGANQAVADAASAVINLPKA